MTVDFRKLMLSKMTPERQAEWLYWEQYWKDEVERWSKLGDQTLANSFEYFTTQSEQITKVMAPGMPVYDSVIWHVIIPEVIKRLKRSGQ